jgi:N-acetylglucosaminyl-diphospho-decaprenol L-rhamnosyltransferase
MLLEHHRSAYRYLSSRYRGPIWAPVRLLLRVGLSARATITPRAQRFINRHTAARQPDATGRIRP